SCVRRENEDQDLPLQDCSKVNLSRIGWRVYNRFTRFIRSLPGGAWLADWTDPLHIARRSLRLAIQQCAKYGRGLVLDIGCGGRPYKQFFTAAERYIGLDLPENPEADVRGDALQLPFQESLFDVVFCSEVLEHVREPARLLQEANRVLKAG